MFKKVPIKTKLSIMMFLQFSTWGAWYVTLSTYLLNTLEFNGTQVGLSYGTTAIAATVTPVFIGRLADQWIPAQKLLFFLNFCGAVILFFLSLANDFTYFYPLLLFYSFLYMPTIGITSAITFQHLANPQKEFAFIRLWGTVGWIIAGLIIGFFELEFKNTPLIIAGFISMCQAFFCFSLPPQALSKRDKEKTLLYRSEIFQLIKNRYFIILTIGLTIACIPSSFYQ